MQIRKKYQITKTVLAQYKRTAHATSILGLKSHASQNVSNDVTETILVFLNNKMAAMLMFRAILLGVELFSQTRTQSLFKCFLGREKIGDQLEARAGSIFPLSLPMRPRTRLNLTPNLLSPPKHINGDWVRVCSFLM